MRGILKYTIFFMVVFLFSISAYYFYVVINAEIAMLVMPGTFHLLDHPEWNQERSRRIKALLSGEYKPKGLMDQYYGPLTVEVIDAGLPPVSYFGDRNGEEKNPNGEK